MEVIGWSWLGGTYVTIKLRKIHIRPTSTSEKTLCHTRLLPILAKELLIALNVAQWRAFIQDQGKMPWGVTGTGLTFLAALTVAFAWKSVQLRAQLYQKSDLICRKHHNFFGIILLV
ncbi:hypothetical protein BJP34_19690 [Moorena producens PAL-8-15-08-1]|uniref:Uncharacterized protein n=1 Tax=Moorena producens PAL-8-15-08-1 TaxID=1458985 RepID=A0A1D8TV03_9CYAN|nr:hypothetical protein BJP34_19690 [Moorena producens PAL-8-15-08-1]